MNPVPTDGYRLLSVARDGTAVPVILVDGRVHPASTVLEGSGVDASSVLSILQRWPEAHAAIERAVSGLDPERGQPLDEAELLAPVLYPPAMFCAGANYWDHMEEMEGTIDRANRAEEPWFFLKSSLHSIVADRASVRMPPKTRQLDYEAELAVVIGKPARDVPAARAAEVVAGYTIINDLSARPDATRGPAARDDLRLDRAEVLRRRRAHGPVADPRCLRRGVHDLPVRLWVNDVLKQDSNTSQPIHNVYEQIEWLSHQLTLRPGDVIATGTPAGVGLPRGDFLAVGDVVRIEIGSCGALTTSIVA